MPLYHGIQPPALSTAAAAALRLHSESDVFVPTPHAVSMSVGMPNINASRPSWTSLANKPLCYPAINDQTRPTQTPAHSLQSQAMTTQQHPHVDHRPPWQSRHVPWPHQYLTRPVTSEDAKVFFEELFHSSSEHSNAFGPGYPARTHQERLPIQQPSISPPVDPIPPLPHIPGMHKVSIPHVLKHDVDPTLYHAISEAQWIEAAVDYENSDSDVPSPLSVASYWNGPETPVTDISSQPSTLAHRSSFASSMSSLVCHDATYLFGHPYLPSGNGSVRDSVHMADPAGTLGYANPLKIDIVPEVPPMGERRCSSPIENVDVAADVPDTSQFSRDDLLLYLRSQNVPYKEIKRRGHFTEAESTLRGRVRTLTKEKFERVRCPKWEASDIRLLRRAVRRYSRVGNGSKFPWKQIGAWMKEHGASYHFAPATVAKKWEEIR